MKPSDKAKETYWLTAADPTRDAPEDRMRLVLKAKYEAGLLQPYNYVKGYHRLQKYMETNMSPHSRKRIIVQLDRFRPKFRETAQKLTDLDLVQVEEWFEKTMLDYDRVFASMAVPACLWRRTGQIYRGNKEFAELINVPIDKMRDVSPRFKPLRITLLTIKRALWPSTNSSQKARLRNTGRNLEP